MGHDGSKLASCSDDKTVKIWWSYRHELHIAKHTSTYGQHFYYMTTIDGKQMNPIIAVDWSFQDFIVTASGDGGLRIFAQESQHKQGFKDDCNATLNTWELVTFIPNAHTGCVTSVQ